MHRNISRVLAACLIAMALTGTASAETCEEKYVRLMTQRNPGVPTRIHATTQIVGGMKSTNWNLQDDKGNWRTEMIDPENMPWSMGVDNFLYSSNDKGKTWQKIREMDEASSPEAVRNEQVERAKTVRNVECGQEEHDGVLHDTAVGEYDMSGGMKIEVREKFWVNPQSGYIPKSETTMKAAGFESFTVQLIELAPDLKITAPQ